jgi:hypothetical protein
MAVETRLPGKGEQRRNVTLSLPRSLIREAKVRAARRDLSLSAFLRKSFERAIQEDIDYEEAKVRALKIMEKGFDLGLKDRIPWTRDELHDRKL